MRQDKAWARATRRGGLREVNVGRKMRLSDITSLFSRNMAEMKSFHRAESVAGLAHSRPHKKESTPEEAPADLKRQNGPVALQSL